MLSLKRELTSLKSNWHKRKLRSKNTKTCARLTGSLFWQVCKLPKMNSRRATHLILQSLILLHQEVPEVIDLLEENQRITLRTSNNKFKISNNQRHHRLNSQFNKRKKVQVKMQKINCKSYKKNYKRPLRNMLIFVQSKISSRLATKILRPNLQNRAVDYPSLKKTQSR